MTTVGDLKEIYFNQIILKLASNCNLRCTYCYWFNDESVNRQPKIMSQEIVSQFLFRLERYLNSIPYNVVILVFHGGEPLLFGKKRFSNLCKQIKNVEARTGKKIALGITTNGAILDIAWLELFRKFEVSVSLSLDSTQKSHKKNRKFVSGKCSYDRVVQSLSLMKQENFDFNVLAVADVSVDVSEIFSHFVDELKLSKFDLLIPDATHENVIPKISNYYIEVYQIWKEHYPNVKIRILRQMIKNILGLDPFGFGEKGLQVMAINTQGDIEVTDTLKIAGTNQTNSTINVIDHDFIALKEQSLWVELYRANKNLPKQCLSCNHLHECKGGNISNRWSKVNGYSNPDRYCSELKKIFKFLKEDVYKEMCFR